MGATREPRLSHAVATRVAWSVWGLTLVLWIITLWLRTVANVGGAFERYVTAGTFIFLSTGAALVASRRPEAPFGWIILLYGVLVATEGAVIGYAAAGSNVVAAWLGIWMGLPVSALITLALLFRPGRPATFAALAVAGGTARRGQPRRRQ